VAKSQRADGVRINKSFHDLFNSPSSKSFVAKGKSRPITIRFNDKEFSANYLHENPSKITRDKLIILFPGWYVASTEQGKKSNIWVLIRTTDGGCLVIRKHIALIYYFVVVELPLTFYL